jgi:hypothetical protein
MKKLLVILCVFCLSFTSCVSKEFSNGVNNLRNELSILNNNIEEMRKQLQIKGDLERIRNAIEKVALKFGVKPEELRD